MLCPAESAIKIAKHRVRDRALTKSGRITEHPPVNKDVIVDLGKPVHVFGGQTQQSAAGP